MLLRRWMWIVWPAFLGAGVMEMLVFAVVDPQDLLWKGEPIAMSRWGICTLAFFAFWGVIMLASAMTSLLAMQSSELNPPESPLH